MPLQAGFDLARPDAVAAARDQVVVAPDEAEVAGFVAGAQIAAHQPVAAELRRGRRLVAPVAQEHDGVGPPVRDAPQFARGQLLARLVDDAHGVAGDGGAHPPRADLRKGGAVPDHQVALGLAVELVDGEAEGAAAPFDQVFAQALAAARQGPQPHAGRRRTRSAQQLQGGGRHEHVADLVARHQAQRLRRVELPRPVSNDGNPVVPGRQQHVEEPADPRPVRGRPEPVAAPWKAIVGMLDAGQVPEQDAMRVQRSFRLPRRARGVDDDGGILGGGGHRLEAARGALERGGQIDRPLAWPVGAEDQAQLGQALTKPLDLRQLLPVGDDRARPAILESELQRILTEELEERHCDEACLVDRHVGDRRFLALREEDRDPVAARQPVRDQHVGEPVGQLADCCESELDHLPGGLDLDQRGRQAGGRVAVDHVHSDVEPLRDRPLVMGRRSLVHLASSAAPMARRRRGP